MHVPDEYSTSDNIETIKHGVQSDTGHTTCTRLVTESGNHFRKAVIIETSANNWLTQLYGYIQQI